MPIDRDVVPEYVVLIDEFHRYKLNGNRQILGEPSDALIAYAKEHGTNIAIDATAWNDFARDMAMSPVERERFCCFILQSYNQTDEQLQELIDL